MANNNDKRCDQDAFWDLSSLVPPRREQAKRVSSVRDTKSVEIHVTAKENDRPYRVEDAVLTERYVTPPLSRAEQKPTPLLTYHPKGSLLHEVRVYPWRTKYDYYETFRQHALALLKKEGTSAPFAEFFSYMPQYTQMNKAQMAYYLWWRTNFRRGEYLNAEFSYLLLYLYELINTADTRPGAEVQDAMVRLWLSYREAHPRLDPLIREWLCDHALLYQVSAPVLPTALYRTLLSGCRLKEYYVPLSDTGDAFLSAVLLFCNNYDYTKSKFFTPDTAADYHRVLRGAVGVAIAYLRERDGNALTGGHGISTISRDTFTGAICSYRLKRRIEIDYTSFSHTHELRYIISDVLKYAENALRAARGVKSRLTVYAVEVPLRERLDAYLTAALPPRVARQRVKREEIPLYEQRYDLPVTEPSRERAAKIEAASWQTTKRLIEAFGEETEEIPCNGVSFSPTKEENDALTKEADAAEELSFSAHLGPLCELVRLAARGDVGAQHAFARERGCMLDALVDEINTVAGDMLGDIILEESMGGFAVIEDYLELLKEEGVL